MRGLSLAPVRVGGWRLSFVDAGAFAVDGGSLHGVVPRSLWERDSPPDARNRVALSTWCVLLEGHGRRILLEAGNGDRWTPVERERHAIPPASGAAPALERAGVRPGDVDLVVVSHLHWDHAGGALDATGAPAFPRARIAVQRREIDDALHPHERSRASYRSADVRALLDDDRLLPLEGASGLAPGIEVVPTPGHTLGHQSVRIRGALDGLPWDGEDAVFFGDLVPTPAHVRLAWIMAFDLHPGATLFEKRRLLADAVDRRSLAIFGHARAAPAGRVVRRADRDDFAVSERAGPFAAEGDAPGSSR